jgi:hypothetical protein
MRTTARGSLAFRVDPIDRVGPAQARDGRGR